MLLVDVIISLLRCRFLRYFSVVEVRFKVDKFAVPCRIFSEKLVKLSLPINKTIISNVNDDPWVGSDGECSWQSSVYQSLLGR